MGRNKSGIAAISLSLFLSLFPNPLFAEETPSEPSKGLYERMQEQGFTGALRADYFSSDKFSNDETDFWGLSGQFKLVPKFNENLDGRIELRISDFDLLNRKDDEVTTELLEGLLILRFENSDLSIGKQIITWGRADGLNPTNNLTPQDYTILLPEEGDRKKGLPSLKYDYCLTPELTATFFYSAFFEPNEVGFAFPSFIRATEDKPVHKIENSEAGFRLNNISSGLDWSLSYYNGFDLSQEVRFIGFSGSNALVSLENHRIQVFGADFAKNYGRYGFRGEAAYMLTEDPDGTKPYIKNPNIFYIIGGDRTFIETLNINIQFIGRYIFDYSDPEAISDTVERAIYQKNATFNNELDERQYSMSSRIDYKLLNETLDLEMFGVFNFNRGDYWLRPIVRYAFTDSWKGTIGAEYYDGDKDRTLYGALEKNNTVFAELKYSF